MMDYTLYIEEKPEHYVGSLGITIRCKPSERGEVTLIESAIAEAMRLRNHREVAP